MEMSKTAIVKTGEQFFIKQLSKSQPIKLDRVIFANINGVNGNTNVDTNSKMPAQNQIVYAAPVTQCGLLNDKTVVYSVILDTSIGDFSFNYIGLVNAETNTLCMVMHTDLTRKIKTAGQRQGNTITESIWLEIDNASESTGITVNAQTWQIDYSKRLAGEDERIRLTNYDLYNRLAIHDGFAITKNGNQLTVSTGVAYVAGLRVNHTAQKSVKVENNQSLYIDAWLAGTVTGEWSVNYNLIAGTNLKDYEKNGFKHFVERVASVDASSKLVVVKPRSFITSFDLSSATDSIAENKAATSLAVKKTYDLASNAVKKSGDKITGQLRFSPTSYGMKFLHENGNELVMRPSGDSFIYAFYNAELDKWANKLRYVSSSNTWRFENIDDVTINNKSALKEGDAVQLFGDLANSNINDLTGLREGVYFQSKNVQATSENNYPINEAGTLQVLKNGADGAGCCQIYTAYRNARQFIRNFRGGTKTWEPWVEQITTENVSDFLPVGIPMPWPTTTPPRGWLKCNGWQFDKNRYPRLAQVYPSGYLPDLRGEFIRGWDDGKGTDPGRGILSWQSDAIRNIRGCLETFMTGATHQNISSGAFYASVNSLGAYQTGSWSGGSHQKLTFDASRVVPTSHDNHPRNLAFMYIVKAE
jgi:hypothetical protein